jgi:two-component system chemotaxis response regulator CheY
MMPGMDGQEALTRIRAQEVEHDLNSSQGATILMTTALDDPQNVIAAYKNLCDGYLVKPISKTALFDELRKHKLLVF